MLSVSTWSYLVTYRAKADLTSAIEQIKADGFGIELWAKWGACPEEFDRERWPALKEMLGGCARVSVHAGEKDNILQDIELAAYMNAEVLVVHGSNLGLPVANDEPVEGWNKAEEVAAYARERDVAVAFENGPPAVMREAVKRLGLGVCIDIGHAYLGQPDPRDRPALALLEEFGDSIIELHLADNHTVTDEHLMPGDGVADWPGICEWIHRTEFAGPCVLELDTPDPRESALITRRFIEETTPK